MRAARSLLLGQHGIVRLVINGDERVYRLERFPIGFEAGGASAAGRVRGLCRQVMWYAAGVCATAYAMDLREGVIAAAHEEGLTQEMLAARFRISAGTVYNWLRREREEGTIAPKPHGGGRERSVDADGESVLTALVEAKTIARWKSLSRFTRVRPP